MIKACVQIARYLASFQGTINFNISISSSLLCAQSVAPVQEDKPAKGLFCRITKAAYDKGVAQQVEDDLRSASVSAPKLVKALNVNDALGYTDTKNLSSTELYNLLDEHYGLSFKPRNFAKYRSAF